MNHIAFAIPQSYRFVAAVTLFALLAWTLGLPSWIHTAHAGNVSQFSDTLSTSDLSASATHTLRFTLVDDITASQTLTVQFDPIDNDYDFDLSALVNGDIAITAVSGGTINQVAGIGSCGGPVSQIYVSDIDTATDTIELTTCTSDTITTGTVVQIVVGSTNFITNPAVADSYVIRLGGTNANVGDTRVAIIDTVSVTASVDTQFTFSINGVDAGVTVNDDTVATTGTSTSTTIPFGTIAPGGANAKLMAQLLQVDTNAYNGFAVTVESDITLTAGNGATIDTFIDGGDTASTTLWTSPAGIMGSPDTYGHWGLTSDDNAVSGASSTQWGIGEAAYRGDFVGNPVEIFYHNTPVESASGGMGIGSTTVAYKVEITALQEAAKDYQATLTYIATPVF